ncbi:MAG: hypothetical protein PHI35_09655 [Victivallaceae bacterium]|nr:hypothetical protein [Victivallaceae bacterium]
MGMAAATVFAWQKFNTLLNSVTFGMKMLGAIDGGKSFASLRQANDTVKLLTADVGNLYKAVGTLRGSMMLLGAAAATAFAGWEIGKALADLINLEAKLTDIKVAMDFVGKNKDNSSGAYTETAVNVTGFLADMVTFGNAEKIGNAVVGGGEALRLDPSDQDKKNLDRMRARKKANPAASTVRKKNDAPAAAGKEQTQAAEEEALRLQAMTAAAESLDEIETKNKKALADVAAAMEKIRLEAAKDAMSEKIDKWRKNMKQWGQDIDDATKKLSKIGLTLDEPVLKSKEQILQSKKDDLLRRKIEAHNKGGSVEFTGEEKKRIAELEALRRRAAEQKKQSKAAEDAIENTQDQATAQERGKAAQERAKETVELTKKKATADEVSRRLADPQVTAVRKQAAAASAATKKQQEATSSDVNLLRVLEQVKEILKKGLPQETE